MDGEKLMERQYLLGRLRAQAELMEILQKAFDETFEAADKAGASITHLAIATNRTYNSARMYRNRRIRKDEKYLRRGES